MKPTNFEEFEEFEEVEKWLSTVKGRSKKSYLSGFRVYVEFMGKNPKELIDDIERGSDKPICRYFKKTPSIALSDNEVIIDEALCEEEGGGKGPTDKGPTDKGPIGEGPIGEGPTTDKGPTDKDHPTLDKINLKFQVPSGRISDIMGIMNLLQSKFDTLEIELTAKGGEISEQDYKDKIEEALRQMGIESIEE